MVRRIFFLVLLVYFQLHPQPRLSVDNIRIFPSTITQTEPVVAVSPVNPDITFVSGVTINASSGFKSEGVYVTTNGGASWYGSDTMKGAFIQNHGGDPGVVIDNNNTFVLNHIGLLFPGVYSHRSTDSGRTWTASVTITSQQPEDKGTTTVDNHPASPYYGRMYTGWVNYVAPYPVLFSYSGNGGLSWSAPVALNSPPPTHSSGGYIKTGGDGKVYLCWAGLSSAFPFVEDYSGLAVSSDGGASWSVTQNCFTMKGINGTLPGKNNIRVNSLPKLEIDNSSSPRRNWLYIVTTEKNLSPAGSDPDIILRRSTDAGATWQPGIRVNQDAVNNGKTQYFPAMSIDREGGINIIYYDDRNTANDSAEVILARSTDGGNSWREWVISTQRFKPKPILGGSSNYQGDHISLTSVGNKLHAYWMDDRTGLYQIWSAIIDLSLTGTEEEPIAAAREFQLYQNFPNPFNPVTSIKYGVRSKEYGVGREVFVSLRIYDVLGNEVATLVNEEKAAGMYEVKFDATALSSGVYFYKLQAGNVLLTKKLVLLK